MLYVEHALPASFAQYRFTAIWDKLGESEDEAVTVHEMLDESEIGGIRDASGVFLSWDLSSRVIYIGSDSQDLVDDAIRKLDNVLEYKASIALK
jgi:hypothetical protein